MLYYTSSSEIRSLAHICWKLLSHLSPAKTEKSKCLFLWCSGVLFLVIVLNSLLNEEIRRIAICLLSCTDANSPNDFSNNFEPTLWRTFPWGNTYNASKTCPEGKPVEEIESDKTDIIFRSHVERKHISNVSRLRAWKQKKCPNVGMWGRLVHRSNLGVSFSDGKDGKRHCQSKKVLRYTFACCFGNIFKMANRKALKGNF